MRHRVKGRKFNRTSSHRLATFRALATAVIKHKKIKTTVAKAKELRRFLEPMITRARQNTVHARREIFKHIKDKDALQELFGTIIEKVGERAGGYTRIVKLGNRKGDAAEMAIIELVDFSELLAAKKPKKAKGEKAGKAEETVEAEEVKAEEKTEEEKEEKPKRRTRKKTPKEEKKEEPEKEEKKPAAKKSTAKKTTTSKKKSAAKKEETPKKKSSASKKKTGETKTTKTKSTRSKKKS